MPGFDGSVRHRGAHGASACFPCAAQSANRWGRRAACPHAAGTGCIDRRSCENRTRFRTRNARPYGGCVGRGCVRRGGAARAAIQAAPTAPPSVSSQGRGLSPAVPGPIFHRALVVAVAGPWREKGIGNREEVRFALERDERRLCPAENCGILWPMNHSAAALRGRWRARWNAKKL